MIRLAILGACLTMPMVVGGCGFSSVLENEADNRAQPYPASYKPELLAFFRNYLNDPVAVRDALMAEPVQRIVGGRQRYVSCLKFNARESDGGYRGARERVVMFKDGRLDRIVDEVGDVCAGAAYAPFPELETMAR